MSNGDRPADPVAEGARGRRAGNRCAADNGFVADRVDGRVVQGKGKALVAGARVALAQISPSWPVRAVASFVTQLLRNSPWLVLLFIVLLAFRSRSGSSG